MRAWLFTSLLSAASAVVAAQPIADHAASAGAGSFSARYADYQEQVLDAASAAHSPRVLAAAAALAFELGNASAPSLTAKREALIERAARLGVDDPVVWRILTGQGFGVPPKTHAQAVRRLRQLAPNNAVGWLLIADEDDDGDANFVRAAHSNRIDLYEGEIVRAMYAAGNLVPIPSFILETATAMDPERREMHMHLQFAVESTKMQSRVWLRAFDERCNARRELSGEPLQECLALARLMVNRSRNPQLQDAGLALLARRLPPGEERSAAEADRRRLDWLRAQDIALTARDPTPASALLWLESHGDEPGVMRALLEQHGVPLQPPAGWRSGDTITPPPEWIVN
jgi:hypothetical protein